MNHPPNFKMGPFLTADKSTATNFQSNYRDSEGHFITNLYIHDERDETLTKAYDGFIVIPSIREKTCHVSIIGYDIWSILNSYCKITTTTLPIKRTFMTQIDGDDLDVYNVYELGV